MRVWHGSAVNMYRLHAFMQVAWPKQLCVLSSNLTAWHDASPMLSRGGDGNPVIGGNADSVDCTIGVLMLPVQQKHMAGVSWSLKASPVRRGRVQPSSTLSRWGPQFPRHSCGA